MITNFLKNVNTLTAPPPIEKALKNQGQPPKGHNLLIDENIQAIKILVTIHARQLARHIQALNPPIGHPNLHSKDLNYQVTRHNIINKSKMRTSQNYP